MKAKTLVSILLAYVLSTACDKNVTTAYENDEETVNLNDSCGSESQEPTISNGEHKGNSIAADDTVSVKTFLTTDIKYQVFVNGYIVGAATSRSRQNKYEFSAPFTYDSAVMIADNKYETNTDSVIAVSLSSGQSSPRAALNLKDNPSNKGRMVIVYGYQGTCCGLPGIAELNAWNLNYE